MSHSVEVKSSSGSWNLDVNPDDPVALARFEFRDGTFGNYIRLLVATNPHTPPAAILMALAQAGCPDSIR